MNVGESIIEDTVTRHERKTKIHLGIRRVKQTFNVKTLSQTDIILQTILTFLRIIGDSWDFLLFLLIVNCSPKEIRSWTKKKLCI